jgi:hypothetical protein
VKPETLRLKRLLAELGIPRGENIVHGRGSTGHGGFPTAAMTTHAARITAVEHADEILAAGYTVILNTYQCGCPELVWLCRSSAPSLRKTVKAWRHDCPVGGELLPVTAIDWLAGAT